MTGLNLANRQQGPRKKLLRNGEAALCDQVLLANMLVKGKPGPDVMNLAARQGRVIGEIEHGIGVKKNKIEVLSVDADAFVDLEPEA